MVLLDSRRVPRVPRYSGDLSRKPDEFSLQDYHLLWLDVPDHSDIHQVFDFPTRPESYQIDSHNTEYATLPGLTHIRFGLLPFRSPLLRKSLLFSFPKGTKMFQFPSLASTAYFIQLKMSRHYPRRVSPFRNPRIKACLAAPRGFSQLATSFIASWYQGIRRLPLIAWPQNN